MHDFLNAIADGYATDPQVRSYTFVFPNVRSQSYFRQALAARMGVEPDSISSMFLTLAELVERGCGMKMASNERLLFMLYKAYSTVRKKFGEEAEPFDRFRFWGQMILRDFNDVDRYLADPAQLFRNVSDYKEIQSFYLTPEQEEIIRTYWRADPYWKTAFENRAAARELPFWNHITHRGEPERKFTQLWAILGELYVEFRVLLAKTGECYPGMAYREVAETVMAGQRLPFNPRLYIFIGFNRLCHAEHALFRQLQRDGLAHFYWDYDPTLMNHRRSNTAGRFISTYVKEFSTCNPAVEIPRRPAIHKVDIIAVPGAAAQAQVAAGFLQGNETALVLADAEMLIPTVSAIPEEYEQINITMGYPLRFSALVQLLSQLIKMQMRISFDASGNAIFFHDDIADLVQHPAVQSAFPEAAAALVPYMREHRLFNLMLSDLDEQFDCLRPLLGTVGKNARANEVAAYINGLLDYVKENNMVYGIDTVAFETISDSISNLARYAGEFGVETDRRTMFEMLEHSLLDRTVPMEGESFEAMQVMGVLETRALGYPNVVMLSMTDDSFPGSDVGRSFIPEALRRAYGLPTRDHAEADSAYHFYRNLSWARSMTAIYDARCGAMRTGQPSRYLTQLLYGNFPGVEVSERTAAFASPAINGATVTDATLSKSFIADQLERFIYNPDSENQSTLSASSIKTYFNCPKQFFLEKVLHLAPPETIERETSSADHGNVVHEVADRIYNYFLINHGGRVDRDDIDRLIDGGFDGLLERELTRSVNLNLLHLREFLDNGSENPAIYTPITSGEEVFYINGIRRELHSLFIRESTPLTILATEKEFIMPLRLTDSLTINFKMIIDRIDQIEENGQTITRIIDYKTGEDSLHIAGVDTLLKIPNSAQHRAILQLLVYCEAYHQLTGIPRSLLRPMIYRLKDMESENFPLLKVNKQPLGNYEQVADEFREKFGEIMERIFDTDEPIVETSNPDCCTYCKMHGKLCRY